MIRYITSTTNLVVGITLLTAVAMPSLTRADGIRLDRYRASETLDDGFYLSRPDDHGHLRPDVVFHLDYANDPLVLETEQGDSDSEISSVVSDQLAGQLNLSLGLWDRLILFGGVGFNLLMEGDTDSQAPLAVTAADGAGIGDAMVGARVRLLGEKDDLFAIGLQLAAIIPVRDMTDDEQNFSGEAGLSLLPEVLMELRLSILRITANVGTQIRKDVDLESVQVEDELIFGLGATVALVSEVLFAHGEIYGSTAFADFGDRESTPLELLLGLKYHFIPMMVFGVAAGPGLTRGVGSPDFRLVATLGWHIAEAKEEAKPQDSDSDGLIDPDDSCPFEAEDPDGFEDHDGCPEADNDQDGILDSEDKCPEEAEDEDGFEDHDGCPEADNDQDGILDGEDKCPEEAEDKDEFEDLDGCPDRDNDQDVISDDVDQCPNEKEDRDEFEDEDGCPDPDNDDDGILDVDDKCPNESGVKEKQGCPVVIIENIEFDVNKAVINARSFGKLRKVKKVIDEHPDSPIRVEGHTDNKGSEKYNQELSLRRANGVKNWLVNKGISEARITVEGVGMTRPIASNDTERGRRKNRRVEFHIAGVASSKSLDTDDDSGQSE